MIALRALHVVSRLKWLLTIRYFSRHWGNALATFGALAVMGLLAVGGGMFLIVYCHDQGAAVRNVALLWTTWIMTIIWVSAPFMQFDAQRNIDLSGMRLLPINRRTFTLAVLLDAALSPLGLYFALLLVLALAAFSLTWLDLAVLFIVMTLLMASLLALGQAIYLWANRLLASRRFTDASIVIGIVLFLGIQLANLAFQNSVMVALPYWLAASLQAAWTVLTPLVQWLFPGVAAQTVAAAGRGDWLSMGALLIILGMQAGACIWLAGQAVRQFYDGELESSGHAAVTKRAAVANGRRGRGWLSGAAGALFHRERLYLWRDPMVKMMLLQSLFGAVYFIIMALMFRMRGPAGMSGTGNFSGYAILGIALLLTYMESGTLFNKFGYEGNQFVHTLVSPVNRRLLLYGKSAYYLLHFGVVNTALIIGLAVLLRVPPAYATAAALMVIANTAIVDVIGNFVSIYMPFGYRRQGRRLRAVMPQPGCGYLLLYSLIFQVCNLAVLPASAALAMGVIFYGWPGLMAAIPVAATVVAAAYRFGVPLAAEHLMRREPELIAAFQKGAE